MSRIHSWEESKTSIAFNENKMFITVFTTALARRFQSTFSHNISLNSFVIFPSRHSSSRWPLYKYFKHNSVCIYHLHLFPKIKVNKLYIGRITHEDTARTDKLVLCTSLTFSNGPFLVHKIQMLQSLSPCINHCWQSKARGGARKYPKEDHCISVFFRIIKTTRCVTNFSLRFISFGTLFCFIWYKQLLTMRWSVASLGLSNPKCPWRWRDYSHASLNDGDSFWEIRRQAISSLCQRHTVYLHKSR